MSINEKLFKMVFKIERVLSAICDAQLDTDVSFWVGRNKVVFELSHRYGGDLRLRAKVVDGLAPHAETLWSNAVYCGVWTEKTWTLRPSDTTRLVEQAVVVAKEKQ